MSVDIESLNKIRYELDLKYDELEKEISKLYSKNKVLEAEEKEKLQDLVDQQLDLIDTIINYLEKTPRLLNVLTNLNDEYKRKIGELHE